MLIGINILMENLTQNHHPIIEPKTRKISELRVKIDVNMNSRVSDHKM